MPTQDEARFAERLARSDEPMFLARTSRDAPGRLRILVANEAFGRLTGFPPARIRGRRVRRLYSPWTQTENRWRLHQAIKKRTPVRTSLIGIRADGTTFPVDWSLIPVGEGDDGVLWTCIVRDASEQSLREELTLVATRAWDLSGALTAIQEAIRADAGWVYAEAWIASRDGRVVKPGPAGPHETAPLQRFRDGSRRRGFRLGEGVPGRVSARDAPEWIEDLSRESGPSFERREAALDAGLRSLLAVPLPGQARTLATLVFYGDRPRRLDRSVIERIVHAVAHLGPILERKQVEAQLRHRATQQEVLARLGVCALEERPDLGGLLRHVARTAAQALHVDFCKVLELLPDGRGLMLRAGVGWRDGVVGVAILGTGRESHGGYTLESNEPVIVEDFHKETRFEPPPLLVEHGVRSGISVIVHGARGKPWGVLGVHTSVRRRFDRNDVHFLQGVANVLGAAIERHRAERELDRYRRHLERRVIERTKRLEASHERLRQTERLAAIGTLAAGLGHDMSNLLLPTLCRLDAMDAAGLPAEIREELRSARGSIDYLRELSQGLRLLALDPDDTRATPGVTDIYAWWREVRPVFTKVLRRGCELRAAFPHGLPPVTIPKHQLTQAVLNLVLNAADAIEEDGRVLVTASAEGGEVAVTVADNGRGMPPEVRRHALDPFYSTKKRSLSTGLGLSLVHALAKRVGGAVSIESEPDEGTRVTLRVRRAAVPARAEGGPAAFVRTDVPRTAALVARLLEAAGYRVTAEEEACVLGVLDPEAAAPADVRRLLDAGTRVVWLGPWPEEEVPERLVTIGRLSVGDLREALRAAAPQQKESNHV